MPVALKSEILKLAQESFDKAQSAADAINLSTFTESIKYARSSGAKMLALEPGFSEIDTYYGIKAWGVMLSFDLRKSSTRAMEIGPRDTYITMHTYMPAMLKIVQCAKGIVVGLRGDGAIGCFGLVDLSDEGSRVTAEQSDPAIYAACDCGDAMIKAMSEVINPILKKGKIKTGLQMGVGIDAGNFVATKIGLGTANELTAYGSCVNNACKRSFGNDEVILTHQAYSLFPKKPNGKTRFPRYPGRSDSYILRYPTDYQTLD